MSALQVKGELQEYYQRKVAEGKNKMLVINALRNKLIHRVYVVVKRGKKYDKTYTPALAWTIEIGPVKEAQLERDILKKAVSIFSKDDGRYSDL